MKDIGFSLTSVEQSAYRTERIDVHNIEFFEKSLSKKLGMIKYVLAIKPMILAKAKRRSVVG